MAPSGSGKDFRLMGAAGLEQGKKTAEESGAAGRDCRGTRCVARKAQLLGDSLHQFRKAHQSDFKFKVKLGSTPHGYLLQPPALRHTVTGGLVTFQIPPAPTFCFPWIRALPLQLQNFGLKPAIAYKNTVCSLSLPGSQIPAT